MLDWGAFQTLAADVDSESVTLSGDTLTLFTMLLMFAQVENWMNAGEPLTDAEIDDVDNMVAQAWAEIEA
jgi:hypothetical protein